ncbi:hypothetical protein BIW11_08229 [Tropilaelaps mercedesae]|uniref:Uncharacterized protein n=1 Tax=Tropilaelaps mercedesae TaxID=418985 RepID=A0A1V9XQG0_9ACAR|nr:hypothetical protein BIW11_08229 [Tropilaelaps mercedesae]
MFEEGSDDESQVSDSQLLQEWRERYEGLERDLLKLQEGRHVVRTDTAFSSTHQTASYDVETNSNVTVVTYNTSSKDLEETREIVHSDVDNINRLLRQQVRLLAQANRSLGRKVDRLTRNLSVRDNTHDRFRNFVASEKKTLSELSGLVSSFKKDYGRLRTTVNLFLSEYQNELLEQRTNVGLQMAEAVNLVDVASLTDQYGATATGQAIEEDQSKEASADATDLPRITIRSGSMTEDELEDSGMSRLTRQLSTREQELSSLYSAFERILEVTSIPANEQYVHRLRMLLSSQQSVEDVVALVDETLQSVPRSQPPSSKLQYEARIRELEQEVTAIASEKQRLANELNRATHTAGHVCPQSAKDRSTETAQSETRRGGASHTGPSDSAARTTARGSIPALVALAFGPFDHARGIGRCVCGGNVASIFTTEEVKAKDGPGGIGVVVVRDGKRERFFASPTLGLAKWTLVAFLVRCTESHAQPHQNVPDVLSCVPEPCGKPTDGFWQYTKTSWGHTPPPLSETHPRKETVRQHETTLRLQDDAHICEDVLLEVSAAAVAGSSHTGASTGAPTGGPTGASTGADESNAAAKETFQHVALSEASSLSDDSASRWCSEIQGLREHINALQRQLDAQKDLSERLLREKARMLEQLAELRDEKRRFEDSAMHRNREQQRHIESLSIKCEQLQDGRGLERREQRIDGQMIGTLKAELEKVVHLCNVRNRCYDVLPKLAGPSPKARGAFYIFPILM